MINILFVCKHNVFRSRIAEILFNKLNKNKNIYASSAGIIKCEKRLVKKDLGFIAEKKMAKTLGIKLKIKSKSITMKNLRNTDILVIVADDVPKSLFERDKASKTKILVWKINDLNSRDINKEEKALKTIKLIEKRIIPFINKLENLSFKNPVNQDKA